MTYRLLLWFDMLEEQGRSTTIRGLFSRRPLLSQELKVGNSHSKSSSGDGCGNTNGGGKGNGNGFNHTGGGDGCGDYYSYDWPKILMVKI